jgi:site-specific DNA-methyltransferase (adenine-specific)
MEVMKQFEDKYFDLAIVDPDFGLNQKISQGGTWASKYKGFDGALGGKPTREYFDELFRVSKNQIIWGGNYFIDMLYPTRCFLIWDKKAKMPTLADCEMAWTSFDKNAKIFVHPRNTGERRIHICQKPIALYEWILDNYAKFGDKILDTHLGSGSSAIASYKKGFEFVGVEINETYLEETIKRIKNHISQQDLF